MNDILKVYKVIQQGKTKSHTQIHALYSSQSSWLSIRRRICVSSAQVLFPMMYYKYYQISTFSAKCAMFI